MILLVRTPSFGGDFRGGQVNLQLRMFESLTVNTLARIWHYMTLCIRLCIRSSMLFSIAASSRWAVSTGLCLRWLATIKVSGPVQPCSNHKISQNGWNMDPQLYGKNRSKLDAIEPVLAPCRLHTGHNAWNQHWITPLPRLRCIYQLATANLGPKRTPEISTGYLNVPVMLSHFSIFSWATHFMME